MVAPQALEQWRTRTEHLLASDLTVDQWCKYNHVSCAALYRWLRYFAEREPELYGGKQNIVDFSNRCWFLMSRDNLHKSKQLSCGSEFLFIDTQDLKSEKSQKPSCINERFDTCASDSIEVRINSAIVSIPARCNQAQITAVLQAVACL